MVRHIENIVARFPSVICGPPHYRHLEKDEIAGLKSHEKKLLKGIIIFFNANEDTQGWIHNIDKSCHYISTPNPGIVAYTDATLTVLGIKDAKLPSRHKLA